MNGSQFKVGSLDIGVEAITRWKVDDEVHLPPAHASLTAFLPETAALDQVLFRPSLDERLPGLLRPVSVDASLLEPTGLSEARQHVYALFSEGARNAVGATAAVLREAAAVLSREVDMEAEIHTALAALLRG